MALKNLKFDPKSPVFIVIVSCVVLFVIITGIYYYFFYRGLKTELKKQEVALQSVKAKYNNDLELVRSYPGLLAKEKMLEAEFSKLILDLPAKKDIPGLLMRIANYEKELRLHLILFKPGRTEPRGFYEAIPFQMQISGPFFNAYKFFYKIASMKRIVDVGNISIKGNNNNGNIKSSDVQIEFSGTTFAFTGAPPASKK